MKKFRNALKSTNRFNTVKTRVATAAGAMVALPGLVMAQATSPGAIMAGELSGGKADVGLIIAAVAVILGFILVWSLVKRASK